MPVWTVHIADPDPRMLSPATRCGLYSVGLALATDPLVATCWTCCELDRQARHVIRSVPTESGPAPQVAQGDNVTETAKPYHRGTKRTVLDALIANADRPMTIDALMTKIPDVGRGALIGAACNLAKYEPHVRRVGSGIYQYDTAVKDMPAEVQANNPTDFLVEVLSCKEDSDGTLRYLVRDTSGGQMFVMYPYDF
jgi:hypothetical protein